MTAQIIPSRTAAETALTEAYGAAKAKLPGTPDVAKFRDAAFESFAQAGLPHRRVEAWHYTDLRALMREALPIAPTPSADAIATLGKTMGEVGLPAQSLVLVDGVFAPELSSPLPDGVKVTSLAAALAEGRADVISHLAADWAGANDPIVALNAALMQDGVIIEVAPGTKVAEPIHLIYATASNAPVARFSRSLMLVGEGASLLISEASFGAGGRIGQTNNELIIVVGDKADVGHTLALTDTARPTSLIAALAAIVPNVMICATFSRPYLCVT